MEKSNIIKYIIRHGDGDWGLAQSPIPNPQSPIKKDKSKQQFKKSKYN
jgi:hypothetical protein